LDESILQKEVENELGAFDHCRKHCFELAVETLHAAFADFRRSQIKEWTGEKALICTCFGVSEEIIERHIESGGLETIEAVTAACSAGGGCGSCQPLIEDILEIYWRENG
jgi:NifU-like protein